MGRKLGPRGTRAVDGGVDSSGPELQGDSRRNGPPLPEPAILCGSGLGFTLGWKLTSEHEKLPLLAG